jgi:hypothetical protein
MKKILSFIVLFVTLLINAFAQQCLSGGCTNFRNQYPATTYTPTTSWTTRGSMSPGNYTLFNVTSGNTYEWTYCEDFQGVSTSWDAQLTLYRETNLTSPICFSTDVCGTNNNNAPYISWTATFTGTVRILTTQYSGGNCLTALLPTYNTLAWRQVSSSCTPPAKPTGFTATAVSSSQINLSWNAVSGAIGYDLSYCDGTYIGFVSGTSYSHTGRAASTTYSYKVQAQKSASCVSGFTSCVSATTPSSCTPPAKPTGLTATAISSSQINISWNAVAGAIGYDLSYCDGTYIGYITGTSYSHTGRVENTTYSYKVQAQKSASCVSGYTSCSSATTPSSCTPPTKPTGFTATAVSSSQINLSWNAVSGAIGYDLSYCDGTYIGFVSGTSYSHTGRVENTTYSYKVHAQKSASCVSGYTSCTSATTPSSCTPPTKPTGFTATAVSSSQINLSWNAVSGAIGYDLSYCDGTYIGFVSGTSYSHTGRVENTTYSYKVQAQKSASCVSGYTSCTSATTLSSCTPPTKPTGFTATAVSSSQINLSWNAVSGAIGYDLSYCDGTYIGFVSGTSFSHTGRVENTTYSYKVQAQKSASCISGYTSCTSATTPSSCTPPTKPTGFTATAVSSSQINLSWNAVSGAIGYDLSYCDGTYIGFVSGTSYSHTGRVENTTYSYKVQAQKSASCVSGYTSCTSATTPSSCTPPAKPTGFTATAVSSSQINLSWNAVSGAIGYDLSYCDGTYIGFVSGTSYSHTGRVENTTYSYKVQAQKSAFCVSGFTSCTSTTTFNFCLPASVIIPFPRYNVNGASPINTELYQPNNYRLKDGCQTATIRIQDWNSTTTTGSPLEITSSTNSWTTQNQRFGGSVLWATKQSYNYFKNIHSRSSYDNNNSTVEGYVNVAFENADGSCCNTNNAAMTYTTGIMYVGLGSSGTLSNSYCSLDIIAHEYAHAVTGSSAKLEYQYESGALNESFSDIFGESTENYILGNNDWLIGSDRSVGYLRSMSNPKDKNQPNTYYSIGTNGFWYIGTNDYGGVHTNSGVQNYWFYLLANGSGGTKTNDNGYSYNLTGIGIEKARAIAYRNLTVYLNSSSDYADSRLGSIQAAEDLYGIGSTEANAVIAAWCAVGLGVCKPDLIVQSAQIAPNTVAAGGQTTASCYNKNQGDVSSNPSTTAFWLSKNQTFEGAPTDTWLKDTSVTTLTSGQTSELLSNRITIPSGTANGTWYIMFGADANDNNNESYENNNQVFVPITVATTCTTPATAGTITGSSSVCQGQNSVTYTVPVIANATSYIWTLPSGATGTSTTNSITVNYGSSAVSGNITVKGHNNCGDGSISSLAITVLNIPTTPTLNSPFGVTVSSINLSWNNVGAASYDVYYTTGSCPWTSGTLIQNTTGTNITISGLSATTTYKFVIVAKNSSNCVSGNSNCQSTTTFTKLCYSKYS